MKKYTLLFALFAATQSFAQQAPDIKLFDVQPRPTASNPQGFTIFNNKLYFAAWDSVHGPELHCIDTNETLSLVADINPGWRGGLWLATDALYGGGAGGLGVTHDRHFGIANGSNGKPLLFFAANNGVDSFQLYQYDGAGAPIKAANILPLPHHLVLGDGLVGLNNKIYFADQGSGGGYADSLWCYDPATGTKKSIFGTVSVNQEENVTAYNGKIYFNTHTSPVTYGYDPATGSVTPVKTWAGNVIYTVTIGNYLYIGTSSGLYRYDGTNDPQYIDDFEQNGSYPIGSYNGKVYYANPNDGHTYAYDPANNSKTRVPGKAISGYNFVEYKGIMYFAAVDSNKPKGAELWQYDGVHDATMAADINGDSTIGSMLQLLTPFGNGIYMSAWPPQYKYGQPGSQNAYPVEVVCFKPATTSVQRVSFNADITAYPNPTTSDVNVAMELHQPAAIGLSLRDITGRTVYSKRAQEYPAGKSSLNLPMQSLPSGTYFYRLTDKNSVFLFSGKLVKE